ncbi:BrnT family toxin [Wenzhouxiangella limi]|uniref:BrnT family toxin n=1 Tax=Wenzhouxiangella limi TaxID=2707351 RepID=A0A845VB48_9GAMM|nr:BrnT family toxin [Wenzhouxiangella limi]NDY97125.1 BrnT family toxin [Wenzhouxiangella limi]
MKKINWNPDKNKQLQSERGIRFEDVLLHLLTDDILDTFDHPKPSRYPDQKIHAIRLEDYVYLVPFIETEDEVFLKTIIPSRKATKQYQDRKK